MCSKNLTSFWCIVFYFKYNLNVSLCLLYVTNMLGITLLLHIREHLE
uniref:Uncharacterized protein n=1 Tax=Arundo donax TaxID=35708 RepID=A0A0A9B9J4_ARUDO